ncbi:MAG: hypothetical protein ACTSYS_13900 [Promethearchaeota archaeon]
MPKKEKKYPYSYKTTRKIRGEDRPVKITVYKNGKRTMEILNPKKLTPRQAQQEISMTSPKRRIMSPRELNEKICDFKDYKIKRLSSSEIALINVMKYCDTDRYEIYKLFPRKMERIMNKVV